MALNIVQYEEIVTLLREVPPLVDQLEARGSGFPDGVLDWLKRAETTLEGNRLAVVSQVSACRAQLIEAGRGVQLGELAFVGRPTGRKIREATASIALQRGNDLLHAAISDRATAFGEAERLARQLLAVADAKGLVGLDDGRPHQMRLSELDRRIAGDPDLASGYVHLVALVGKTDVLIFIDRALSGLAE
jgi:hypothetical protein